MTSSLSCTGMLKSLKILNHVREVCCVLECSLKSLKSLKILNHVREVCYVQECSLKSLKILNHVGEV